MNNNVFCQLDESDKSLISSISKITLSKYEIIGGDFIRVDYLLDILFDLKSEYETIKEEFDDYKKDVNDNYRPISIQDQIEGCK